MGDGNEGMVYGLLTTAGNLGGPFARAVGNQIYGTFQPSLSDDENYIEDTVHFRHVVYSSFLVQYGFSAASLLYLCFLPKQKEDAQEPKRTWTRRTVYGVVIMTLLGLAFCYSLTINLLSIFPSTMCMKIVGGNGCDSS